MPPRPRRSPPQKKRLALSAERDARGKSNKGFRDQWPRKKAGSKRAYRHATKQALAADLTTERLPEREQVRKWPGTAPTLDEKIAAKKERRSNVQKAPRKSSEARARRRARRSRSPKT